MSRKWTYITISSGHKVKVDAEDAEKILEKSWRVTLSTTGRKRVVTSVRTKVGVRSVSLGKFLMNPKKGLQVYPRRFNEELDYRKENLIVCTLKERQRLLPKNRVKSSSKYRGVSYVRSTGRWRAGIEVEGKSINLGEFKKEAEAAETYNKAAKKHFGALAYQNPINQTKKDRR